MFFDLFKVHQDAELLHVDFKSPDYKLNEQKIPAINVSASKDSLGKLHRYHLKERKKKEMN